MQQHVWILILGRFGPIPFWIGVSGYMEGIVINDPMNMIGDILGKLRIDLVEHVLAIIKRPHLTDGFISHPGDDPADVLKDRIRRVSLVLPILLRIRQFQPYRKWLVFIIVIRHDRCSGCIVLHVIDPRTDIDQGLEHWVRGDIRHLLAVHEHHPAIANRFAVLLSRSNHDFLPALMGLSAGNAGALADTSPPHHRDPAKIVKYSFRMN